MEDVQELPYCDLSHAQQREIDAALNVMVEGARAADDVYQAAIGRGGQAALGAEAEWQAASDRRLAEYKTAIRALRAKWTASGTAVAS